MIEMSIGKALAGFMFCSAAALYLFCIALMLYLMGRNAR